MRAEKRWALTFVLKDYLQVSETADETHILAFDGSWNTRIIGQGLRVLFEESVLTPTELAKEINERTGVKFRALELKRYADNIFVELAVVNRS